MRNFKGSWRHIELTASCFLAAVLTACSGQGAAAPQGELPPTPPEDQQAALVPNSELDALATTTGPIVYIDDSNGVLWTVNLSTNTIHRIGSQETILTDLAFDPINHVLYGVSFNEFYRVNTTTGIATPIGPLGITDANALVFDVNGKGYSKGFNDTSLYAINNVATGRASLIGSTGLWKSAGDLTYYNNTLILSGFTGTMTTTTREAIVTLNRSTGAVLSVAQTNVTNLYGLVSTSASHLYGFANTSMYRIIPNAATVAQRSVLIKNFATSGVGQIMGAAYNGNFQI